MPERAPTALSLAQEYARGNAGHQLTPQFAKLYSQHTRLRTGQAGLAQWRTGEADDRLLDALHLIEASSTIRRSGAPDWREPLRRAGEVLEWLAHPALNTKQVPLRLLASAAYQLSGYPARADGLLRTSESLSESRILGAFLTSRFQDLLEILTNYWATTSETGATLTWNVPADSNHGLSDWVVKETCSSLGVICSEMRWGNETRTPAALKKLDAIARLLLHGHDQYSWLVARLCADFGEVALTNSLRKHVARLEPALSEQGRQALENYVRMSYRSGRSLVWPSQIRGIESLATMASFALCTPTGSGKTSVAELGIIQSLFPTGHTGDGRIAMYLVPSRALAIEVESRMARVLRQLTAEPIVVTGLYGGNDWGPTDAWLTRTNPTVLICTYEKADALLRFLGPLFVKRISLLVLDEAHSVQFDGRDSYLQSGESRSLRLETLGARLFSHLGDNGHRTIGLSAVAGGAEPAIARWITGQADGTPVSVRYRSTRQLVGRLECNDDRRFVIRYDVLDGSPLHFEEAGRSDTPFIPNPLPLLPAPATGNSPEARLRTHALWAALHLASGGTAGKSRSVLISITQHINTCAEEYLRLLEDVWDAESLPPFFHAPQDPRKKELLEQCLRSCEDYFGIESREYKLLRKGIAVHHGKMPGILARLLVEAIQERIINVVVATSTLSEGVNLPFETILIPNLRRARDYLSVREFANLVGRAGRPGYGTEGQTLVLLEQELNDRTYLAKQRRDARAAYDGLIAGLGSNRADPHGMTALSPLAGLLNVLRDKWSAIAARPGDEQFLSWLEEAAPANEPDDLPAASKDAFETLDSLDAILLAAVTEIEELSGRIGPDELERKLKNLWARTYAKYSADNEARLSAAFVCRGRALMETVYPDKPTRSRLYRSSLPPRAAKRLVDITPEAIRFMKTGSDYAIWNQSQQLTFIEGLIERLARVPKFSCPAKEGNRNVNWRHALNWWLSPATAENTPAPDVIADWHAYISKQFGYRFNWGLSSVIAMTFDQAHGGELKALTLADWPNTGLPWIIFWAKELMTWGTLNPVVAYLLSRGRAITRAEAEVIAESYFATRPPNLAPDELFNATSINRWYRRHFAEEGEWSSWEGPVRIRVRLLRDFRGQAPRKWRVIPVVRDGRIRWLDPAGFVLAESAPPENWEANRMNSYDFFLDPQRLTVAAAAY